MAGQTARITVAGEVLRWAREQRGLPLEVAAKRLNLSVERLEAIEAGDLSPTVAQLRNMSDKYRRPLIVLLLDEVPTTFTPLNDFRLLPDEEQVAFSPELHDEIRRAVEQQEVLQELSTQLDDELKAPALPAASGDAVKLAQSIRDALGLELVDQSSWTDPRVAFVSWRDRIEELGILVLETSRVQLGEMRGFSLSEQLPYVIAINGSDSDRGKTFTLLHELCHLIMRQPGLCDMHPFSRTKSDIEVFCNEVAGEALVPRERLLRLSAVKEHPVDEEWDDDELHRIQRVFGGASIEVVLRRLLELGRASKQEYEQRRRALREAYEEFRRSRNKASKGGPPPHRIQIRDRGRPFVRTAFNAYSEGVINLNELTTLVGVRTKHLKAMQSEAFR